MKKLLNKTIPVILALSMLAGCSSTSTTTESTTTTTDTTTEVANTATVSASELEETTTFKENIRIGTLSDLTTTNRYAGTATVTTQTCNSTFNGLVSIDAEGNATPELATSWESNEDSTEWTFVLRDDVKFHDGSDFTAEDVKFTWDYASTTQNDGINQAISGISYVKEVTVVDPYTVTMTLNAPSADWLNYAAQDIMSKSAVESLGFDEGGKIGTGPFYFDTLDLGVSWTITRFEDYWGEKPVTKSITFVVITDASSRALALQAGDIDAMYDGNASDIVNFINDGNYTIAKADNIQVVYAGFNAKSEYGSNPIVRQAVAMSINRDDVVAAAYEGGACGTPVDNLISSVASGYVDVDAYEYDPEGAKQLLEENGLSGITLNLYTFAKYIPTATIIQANLLDAGINVVITEWAQSGFTAAILEDNKYDLAVNCTSQYGGIMTVLIEYLRSDATRSFMNYNNPEFDDLLDDALASSNFEEMLDKYADLQQYVADDVPGVPLCMANLFCIGSSNFGGVNLNAQAVDVDFTGCYVIE